MITRLTDDEWDFLQDLIGTNGMDVWFSLRQDDVHDFVYDLENEKEIDLRDGISELSEGVVSEDIEELGGKEIWNNLMDKLNLTQHKI